MDEQKIRDIVRDEMKKNYMSGSPDVPLHTHDGVSNLQLTSNNVIGFSPLPSGNTPYQLTDGSTILGFANSKLLQKSGARLTGNTNALYPLSIIFSDGGLDGFQGGYAPDGTVTLFIDPLIIGQAQLWVLINQVWYGVNLSTTP